MRLRLVPRRPPEPPAALPQADVASSASVRRLRLDVARRLDGLLHGDHLGHLPGPGSEPGEARVYVPGDDVRRIDWAVTARAGDVHVRTPVAERELETTLVVDLTPSMSFGTVRTEKREVAVVLTAALAHLAQGPGDRIGAVVLSDRVRRLPPRPGRDAELALLHVLRGARPPDAAGPALSEGLTVAASTARRRGLVVVVSDLIEGGPVGDEPRWAGPLRRIGQRHDLVVVEVVDPRELELPSVGVLRLVDPETGQQQEVDTSSRRLRERYAAAADERRAGHAAAVRRAGGTHVVVRTDRDWLPDLARALAARRRLRAAGRPAGRVAMSLPQDFLAPARLWLLLLVAALAVGYVVLQRRRSTYALRFTELPLLASVAPRVPPWRRHVPAVLLLVALTVLTTAFARPEADVQVPRERATVVLAIDVSLSMEAVDVEPDRLAAAQRSAVSFVERLPEGFAVGLVSFSGSAAVVVPPTQDHAEVVDAVRGLQLGPSTAIGEAVFASLEAVRSVPVQEGDEPSPARIVLLTDGTNTVGRAVGQAAEAARNVGVPVSTIAFGTPDGVVEVEGQLVPVPVDVEAMEALALDTGGAAFTAESGDELDAVYDDISAQVGTTTERREITDAVAGVALLLALLAAAGSLAWGSRLP